MEALVRSLFSLIEQGNLQAVGDVLKVNPSLAFSSNKDGVSPVLFAVYCGRVDLARTIAALRGTAPDLFESAALGDAKAIHMSLNRSPELIDKISKDGFSLAHLAAFFGHCDLLALLLEKGANPNAVSRNDLHLHVVNSAAAQRDHAKALRSVGLLLLAGADANAAQKGGYTVAHSAAAAGNLELLSLLRKQKAALDRKTDDGKTPLDIARERNQPAAIAFLQA
jgi:uncharacterized protein